MSSPRDDATNAVDANDAPALDSARTTVSPPAMVEETNTLSLLSMTPPASSVATHDDHAPSIKLLLPTNSASDAPSPKRQPIKNASRERMKQELKFLRARVQELDRELHATMAANALQQSHAVPVNSTWKALAMRHAARREQSEKERARLRARLLHQLQVAKSLEQMFRNRSGTFLEDVAMAGNRTAAFPVHDMALLHRRLMDEIDDAYLLVHTVFPAFSPVEKTGRWSTVVVQEATNGEDEQLFVELRSTSYVPFPFDRVCSAVWRAVTTEYTRQQRIVEQFCLTEAEFASKIRIQILVPGGTNHMTTAIGIRRFQQTSRMVLVCRSVDWDDAPLVKCQYGDDTGWVVVESAVDPASGECTNGATTVRVCSRYVPNWEDQAKLLHARKQHLASGGPELHAAQLLQAGEFTTRILNGAEEDIAAITESIETILLDESIAEADETLAFLVDGNGGFADEDLAFGCSVPLQNDLQPPTMQF